MITATTTDTLATHVRTLLDRDPAMRNIQRIVTAIISAGAVLSVEKVKYFGDGGKQVVTVGPYHIATEKARRFSMYYGRKSQQQRIYVFADDAARDFIGWVDRDAARQAVREWLERN